MTAAADHQKTPPRPSEDLGQTLLERFIGEALLLIVEAAQDKERLRNILHPLATTALFDPTKDILSHDLLDILKADSAPETGRDTREARFLRSPGQVRGLPLHRLQEHAVSLLLASAVPKAKIARAWAGMLIFDAARRAFLDVRKKYGQTFSAEDLQSDPVLPNNLLQKGYDLVGASIKEGFEHTTIKSQKHGGVTFDKDLAVRFLHYSASEIVQAMDRQVHVNAAFLDLETVVYPAIEAYDLQEDLP